MAKPNDRIGPYILIDKIGRGAFGIVWLAEKRTAIATTRVAIKLATDEDIDLGAIKREASVWVQASGHSNVLPIIDADIYGEQIIIVSEYAPDGPLSKWLTRHGGKAPSVESAVEMSLGILAGLEHLHKRGIIHRDLKPDNILLQNDTPRLADFGIAKILKTTSKSTNVSGTPAYMPPEAFDGRHREQGDLWTVGIILYQLLSGRLPFPETEFTALVGAILTREPAPLPQTVPMPLQRVIGRALRKEPSERYQSAGEMRQALREAPSTLSNNGSGQDGLRPLPGTTEILPAAPVHSSQVLTSKIPHSSVPSTAGLSRRKLVLISSSLLVLLFVGIFIAVLKFNSPSKSAGIVESSQTGNTNDGHSPAANINPATSSSNNSAAPTPTPLPSPQTVQVRVNQILFPGGDWIDWPVANSNIILQSGERTFQQLTDKKGAVVFDQVPCGDEITIKVYEESTKKDYIVRKHLGCEKPKVELVTDGEELTERKPKFMMWNSEKGRMVPGKL